MNVFRRLRQLLDKKQKWQFMGLMVLVFISAVFETLGVSVIVPIISAVVMPEELMTNKYVIWFMSSAGLDISDEKSFVRLVLIAAIAVYVVKNLYMLFLSFLQSRYVTGLESRTSKRVFGDYLNRPYEFYLNADVNAIFQSVNKDIPHVFILLQEVMYLVTEAAVVLCLAVLLLIVNVKMTLFIGAVMFLLLLLIVFLIRPALGKLGTKRVNKQVEAMKWMQQGVFGIKDVKVAVKEHFFLREFSESYKSLAEANRKYTVFSNAPRLGIELACMSGALVYMLICVEKGIDMKPMLPELSAFAMAAVRLMPGINRISTHLANIAYYESSLNLVCDNLHIKELGDTDLPDGKERMSIKSSIELKDIRFKYPGTEKYIFDNASLEIPVGKSIGITGPSGSGKTTVVDILLGLLMPEAGGVYVDGKDIRTDMPLYLRNTGYIAQNIYMLDSSIRENVAFGLRPEESDEERIWEVLKEAQLYDFVKSLPEGLDTVLGDRGVRISGGQRQRIGIARALYNDPELLVFDEATSALDNETEAAVMDAINSLKGKKTMVIIAHRLKTVEECDMRFTVEDGKISRSSE